MELSLQLRVAGAFIYLVSSAFGIIFPLLISGDDAVEKLNSSIIFRSLRTFCAGLVVSVALIHMLSDASLSLAAATPYYQSLGFTIATAGIWFMLTLNIVVSSLKYSGSEPPKSSKDIAVNNAEHDLCSEVSDIEVAVQTTKEADNRTAEELACSHSHAINAIFDQADSKAMIKVYLLEVAIATHSIIIGLNLGLYGEGDIGKIESLIPAISIHQFFEGMALGFALVQIRHKLSFCKCFLFCVTFALTTPTGVVMGILISEYGNPSANNDLTIGCLNAFAAGILLYISLIEMVAQEFSSLGESTPRDSKSHSQRTQEKLLLSCALALGMSVMAILAIWA